MLGGEAASEDGAASSLGKLLLCLTSSGRLPKKARGSTLSLILKILYRLRVLRTCLLSLRALSSKR